MHQYRANQRRHHLDGVVNGNTGCGSSCSFGTCDSCRRICHSTAPLAANIADVITSIPETKKPALTRVQTPTPSIFPAPRDLDLWPFDPKINKLPELTVKHFYIKTIQTVVCHSRQHTDVSCTIYTTKSLCHRCCHTSAKPLVDQWSYNNRNGGGWRHYAEAITAGISQASGGHTTAEWREGEEEDWQLPAQRAHGRTSSHNAA